MLLDGHVHAATQFLPMLAERPGATYTIVTGMGAHHVMPGTSLLFVATGGVLSLSKVLRAEYEDGPIKVNEILIKTRVEKKPRPGVTLSTEFGRAVASLITSSRKSEVVSGELVLGPEHRRLHAGQLAVLGDGDALQMHTQDTSASLLVLGGVPLREPVARHGPFVMNTPRELATAFEDYRAGRLGRIDRIDPSTRS